MADIPTLTEQAFADFLRKLNLTKTPNIYMGHDSPDGGFEGGETPVQYPCCIVECSPGERFAVHSPNEKVTVQLRVRTNRDDASAAAHEERAAEIFERFRSKTISEELSVYPGFTCEYVLITGSRLDSQTGRHLESILELFAWVLDRDLIDCACPL